MVDGKRRRDWSKDREYTKIDQRNPPKMWNAIKGKWVNINNVFITWKVDRKKVNKFLNKGVGRDSKVSFVFIPITQKELDVGCDVP